MLIIKNVQVYAPEYLGKKDVLVCGEQIEYMADVITERALGNFHKANELQVKFAREFGKYEQEIERYYDQFLAHYSLKMLLRLPAKRRDFIWF